MLVAGRKETNFRGPASYVETEKVKEDGRAKGDGVRRAHEEERGERGGEGERDKCDGHGRLMYSKPGQGRPANGRGFPRFFRKRC
jgi:hypothetical protein